MAMNSHDFSSIDIEETNEDEAQAEVMFAKRRCCFCLPHLNSPDSSSPAAGSRWWSKFRSPENNDGVWTRGIESVKKVREWSEIVAGPKWKTFIRRFNRSSKSGLVSSKSSKFQYDPLSYALNFDEGPGQNGDSDQVDDYLCRNFSSRYANVAKASAENDAKIVKSLI
ncbi:uncharacterized protein LOC108221092 [Daucus carota subsp. sativus]|uniref:Uncharacterized protein n=2 Tax=Daucus carota subsp. sativus TaxID=79200 RepID=A0A164XJ80_DAUCS|nr:PREDICTED: uncharacterized protein LOC108221092 [Daucus carota subsp. sativus]